MILLGEPPSLFIAHSVPYLHIYMHTHSLFYLFTWHHLTLTEIFTFYISLRLFQHIYLLYFPEAVPKYIPSIFPRGCSNIVSCTFYISQRLFQHIYLQYFQEAVPTIPRRWRFPGHSIWRGSHVSANSYSPWRTLTGIFRPAEKTGTQGHRAGGKHPKSNYR